MGYYEERTIKVTTQWLYYKPPVDLYLSFEKSSWKNQVRQTGFFNLQKSKLIFAGYTGSKNPVQNRLNIQFIEHDFSNLIFK